MSAKTPEPSAATPWETAHGRLLGALAFLSAVAAVWAMVKPAGPLRVVAIVVLLVTLALVGLEVLRSRQRMHNQSNRKAATLGGAMLCTLPVVVVAVTALASPGARDWLLSREPEPTPTAQPGQEEILVEAATFEFGDVDLDGTDDRVRVRFVVRNLGSGPALVDRLLVGFHPGGRVGGGNYSDLWLDSEVVAVDREGDTTTFVLNQRDRPDDAYALPVRAHVSAFGACGHDELVEVRPSGEVPPDGTRDFEVNLPLELEVALGLVSGSDQTDQVDTPVGPYRLFEPLALGEDDICFGAGTQMSVTATSTGGSCDTAVLDADRSPPSEVEFDETSDPHEASYFGGLCTMSIPDLPSASSNR
jgi:hypothetical protein